MPGHPTPQNPVTPLSIMQIRNGLTILRVVRQYQHDGNWHEPYARRVARLCIQCALTESELRNYANPHVPGSMQADHDDGAIGTDHASVGVFQQQVPMWGDVAHCQNVDHATHKFLDRLLPINMHDPNGAMQIQRVQVSAYSDGENYRRNFRRAMTFMAHHWDAATAPSKSKKK